MALRKWLKYSNAFRALGLLVGSAALTGCLGQIWTGASLIYDRHHLYLKMDDLDLGLRARQALYHDKHFKRGDCMLELTVFHRDMLVVGHVPNVALQQEVYQRLAGLPHQRHLFMQLSVSTQDVNAWLDTWITTKLRGEILSDSSIDPTAFRLLTFDGVVYLLGDVMPEQAEKVIHIAKTSAGVVRVVTLLHYYRLSHRGE